MKRKVILHTDIGGDIDDTWALAMLLNLEELDPIFVITDTGDAEYRAKLCAKALENAGRSNVEIGIGRHTDLTARPSKVGKWVEDYDLSKYPGKVYRNGAERLIEIVEQIQEPLTIISIGPCSTIGEMCWRKPSLAAKVDFVGMFGSIYKNHRDKAGRIAEFNVVKDIPAAKTVFRTKWKSMTITPLDTCGNVVLQGNVYQRLLAASQNVLVRDILASYRVWADFGGCPQMVETGSSILYDTVAVHLAYSTQFLKMEKLPITINDDGMMEIDPNKGQYVDMAMDWLNLPAYCEYLVDVLTR